MNGFSTLKTLGKDVGVATIGLILGIVGVVVSLIPFIEILGIILVFVGNILFGIGIYKLGSIYNNELVKVGGIITAIPIISFIGIIMTYIGSGEILRSLGGRP